MDDNKRKLREAIVKESREWIGTSFHHEARVKGSGVDCGMLLLEIFERIGLLPHIVPLHYSPDFMLHRNEEWYLNTIKKYATELPGPPYLPGDVIIFKHGRLFSHGSVIIDYPKIIHAFAPARCVCYGDADQEPLKSREKKFFRLNALMEK